MWPGRDSSVAFGGERPITPGEARLLGYLIGDGYVGGKTPVQFINIQPSLRDDVTKIVQALGCDTTLRRRSAAALDLTSQG